MLNNSTIGHFHIEAHLGSGRFTDVYRAVDTVRKRTVALKVLKPNLLPKEQSLWLYLEKAQRATELIHPHIAWIWETGEEGGAFYLVERFVDGSSLAKLFSESGTISWEQIHPILDQIAQGLDFAHAKGWMHGMVKPENILISSELGAVLTDFGLTSALLADLPSSKYQSTLRTGSYMAPEVLQGEPLSPKSDQYSLAFVAAEALVGYELTEAFTKTSYEPNLQEPRKLPTSWPSSVPWQVRIALERALSNDPNSRYSTVGEFVGAPEALTIRVVQTPETRTQWEAETRARQDAAEQSRLQAEEQARLAALEQARRELQEELQQVTQDRQVDSEESALPESQKQPSPPPSSDGTTIFHKLWRKWLVWILIGALAMVLVGLLLFKSFSGNGLFHLTDTPTSPPILPTLTLTETGAPTKTLTPSQTLTRSPTETTTKTSRQTWTHTPIHTPTYTSTPIQTPYPYSPQFRERTPPEIDPSH